MVILSKSAEINKVNLEFKTTVSIPILNNKESLVTNKINKVYGILNGTCNYIYQKWRKQVILSIY